MRAAQNAVFLQTTYRPPCPLHKCFLPIVSLCTSLWQSASSLFLTLQRGPGNWHPFITVYSSSLVINVGCRSNSGKLALQNLLPLNLLAVSLVWWALQPLGNVGLSNVPVWFSERSNLVVHLLKAKVFPWSLFTTSHHVTLVHTCPLSRRAMM